MRKKRPAHARSHVPTRTLSGVIGGKKQFSENRSLRAEEVSFSNRAREGARPVKVPSPPTMEGGKSLSWPLILAADLLIVRGSH